MLNPVAARQHQSEQEIKTFFQECLKKDIEDTTTTKWKKLKPLFISGNEHIRENWKTNGCKRQRKITFRILDQWKRDLFYNC